MTIRTQYLVAAAAIGALASPAAAQYGSQQPYPQQAYPGYAQPGYGYGQQGYAQNPVGQIINSLLGNRYSVTDRQAVSQCASAAMTQAAAQYGGGNYNRYGGQYGQGYGQPGVSGMRVTSITGVQRRNNGLRVSGVMTAGYGGQYAYQNRGYGTEQVSFRCNVDYRGAVTGIRIGRNNGGYRR
jgi:hypothetical protein